MKDVKAETSAALEAPRWRALVDHVARWYAEPLGRPGATLEELAAAEVRLGRPLPRALREWFLLVGHRLRDVNQDRPVPLAQLERRGDRLAIWWENQGNWSFDVELDDADDDPFTSIATSPEDPGYRRDRLSRVLLGMLHSDLLVGVWSGAGAGPLGPLAPTVVGGSFETEDDALAPALPSIDLPTNPYFEAPLRGHASLVVRCSESMLEWMAATGEAVAEAKLLLSIEEEDDGAPRVLVLMFEGLTADEHALVQAHFESDTDFTTARFGRDRSTVEYDTDAPDEQLAALRATLPPALAAKLSAGHRPQSTMRFVPCWPPNATSFDPGAR